MGLSMDDMVFFFLKKDANTGIDQTCGATMEYDEVAKFFSIDDRIVRRVEVWELNEAQKGNPNPNPVATLYSLEDLENL